MFKYLTKIKTDNGSQKIILVSASYYDLYIMENINYTRHYYVFYDYYLAHLHN